jgi:hypothetical protein
MSKKYGHNFLISQKSLSVSLWLAFQVEPNVFEAFSYQSSLLFLKGENNIDESGKVQYSLVVDTF